MGAPGGHAQLPDRDHGPGAVPTVPGERSLLRRTLRPVLSSWVRLRVDGEHHVPVTGPVLIASTHLSHADSVAIALSIERPVHFLGDLALTHVRVVGPHLSRLGMVPLRRGEADEHALDVLEGLLAAGACIAVYPEGSRSRDGKVHRLRSGVARLAADAQVPVVPAAVLGIDSVWPIDGRPRLRGGKVTVRFGVPLEAPGPTPRARRAFNLELQRILATLAGVETDDTFSPFHGGEQDGAA